MTGYLFSTAAPTSLSDDILYGASAIALFLFGSTNKRRRVYYLADKGILPVSHLGSRITARRSTLVRWFEEKEQNLAEAR